MDITGMFGKLKDMQAKLKEVQENLDKITAEGEAGAGMVKAIVNGRKKVISVEIDESLLNKEEKIMVQDLVVAAVNIAIQNVEEKASEEVRKTTQGMMPNIPGLDFNNMF